MQIVFRDYLWKNEFGSGFKWVATKSGNLQGCESREQRVPERGLRGAHWQDDPGSTRGTEATKRTKRTRG